MITPKEFSDMARKHNDSHFVCPACDGKGSIEGGPDMCIETGPDSDDLRQAELVSLRARVDELESALDTLRGEFFHTEDPEDYCPHCVISQALDEREKDPA